MTIRVCCGQSGCNQGESSPAEAIANSSQLSAVSYEFLSLFIATSPLDPSTTCLWHFAQDDAINSDP